MRHLILSLIFGIFTIHSAQAFVHPGCLSTQEDLNRMSAKVNANQEPWLSGWQRLIDNTNGYLDDAPLAQTTISVGGGLSENYIRLAQDCAKAYQCALRYNISGETAYGNKAVELLNSWASTMTGWAGDSNVSLRAGLYGYQMACAAELMRNYSGWKAADFANFKTWMVDVFYDRNTSFLTYKHGTVDGHYWANWDLSVMASMMAIGVLCDRQDIFNEGLDYFYHGSGSGNVRHSVHWIHPDGLGQWQESGRDQGHALLGIPLITTICEIAWNQGIDLYGYDNNRVLAGCEYVAKYNLGYDDLSFIRFVREYGHPGSSSYEVHAIIASWGGRGAERPGWDMLYNHYVNRRGLSAPYSQQYAEQVRPDGGGFNYGSTSGGYDQLGFTTLTHTLDPIDVNAVPTGLVVSHQGPQLTLSWQGVVNATSYSVKRSLVSGGPYTTLDQVGGKGRYYIDPGLTPGTTYYYVVSANTLDSESFDCNEVAATADGQLFGEVIGTDGSWNSKGADKYSVYDGSLNNFFDGPSSVSWAGLDLGEGVSAKVTDVEYCPREGFSGRMVGGKFQGSNSPDFDHGVTTLYTIIQGPRDGELTRKVIENEQSFRYLRYVSPSGGYGNVADVQFLGDVNGLDIPMAPGLTGTRPIEDRTLLTWNVISEATHYRIRRATTSGGPYTVIASGAFTSYEDSDLDPETTYFYGVTALNSMGESELSNQFESTYVPPEPDLVAYYLFDGDLVDSSGYGHDAVATGSPSYTNGKVGQAIQFDGDEDYVTLPAGVANAEDITVAAWVNWDGGNAWQRIFDFGNDTSQYLFLTPRSGSNTFRFAIKDGGSEQILETSQLNSGQWKHVAVTLNGDKGILYVDGQEEDSSNSTTIDPLDFEASANFIGESQWPDPLYQGLVDEFMIYNYALSSREISELAGTSGGHR